MKGIVITTTNEISIRDFAAPRYQSIGEVVGGTIEIIRANGLPHPYCMVVNDEGLLLNLQINAADSIFHGTPKHGSPIVGNIVLMKEGMTSQGPDFVDFHDGEAEKLTACIVDQFSGLIKFKAEGGENSERKV